jgi:hypothetical protein
MELGLLAGAVEPPIGATCKDTGTHPWSVRPGIRYKWLKGQSRERLYCHGSRPGGGHA